MLDLPSVGSRAGFSVGPGRIWLLLCIHIRSTRTNKHPMIPPHVINTVNDPRTAGRVLCNSVVGDSNIDEISSQVVDC